MSDQQKRQRVEGTLHRVLPATITIRAAAPDGEGRATDDGLLRLHISASSEIPYLRQSWWDDPWIEVLGHKPGECDLSRFQGGSGVVLANHDRYTTHGNTPLASIGKIEGASLGGGRMEADLVISRREALADLRQDIADDLVRNVSIGYTIEERVLTRQGKDGEADEYRVTRWMPFEISLVDIPADATVGLGRSLDAPDPQNPQSRYRVIDLPAPTAGAQPSQGERSMEKTQAPAAEQQTATRIETPAPAVDPLKAERERMSQIRAFGREFGMTEFADQAIDAGTSVDAFRAQLLGKLKDTGKLRPAESPEIGMSKREVESFSFCRALLAASDPLNAAKIAPFENECSRAAQEKRDSNDVRQKEREAAITIPVDVLNRGIAVDQALAAAITRRLIAGAAKRSAEFQAYVRDLVVGTATAGGNLVATELLGSSFIELLRNVMVLDKLGVTFLRDLNGNIAIPAHTGAATGYWLAENGAPTESQQTVGQVTLSPKTVGAFTDYSRRLLLQSSLDVEAFVRADLASVLGLQIQYGALVGGGTNEPTGLLNISGIGSVAGGTDGLAPTYDHMVDLETAVSVANADVGNMAYLTNAKVRGKLRKTQEFSSTNGKPVWTSGRERGIGEVLGYDAIVSNTMPSNLVKGSSGAVCSAIAFGNWADMIIGMWGGLDIMLDPYANATSGGKRVIALQDVDVNVRNVGSFAVMKDAKTS